MDRGTWQATVLGVAKSWTRLSDRAQPSTTGQETGHICWGKREKCLTAPAGVQGALSQEDSLKTHVRDTCLGKGG